LKRLELVGCRHVGAFFSRQLGSQLLLESSEVCGPSSECKDETSVSVDSPSHGRGPYLERSTMSCFRSSKTAASECRVCSRAKASEKQRILKSGNTRIKKKKTRVGRGGCRLARTLQLLLEASHVAVSRRPLRVELQSHRRQVALAHLPCRAPLVQSHLQPNE
jgi:hypothetical protein